MGWPISAWICSLTSCFSGRPASRPRSRSSSRRTTAPRTAEDAPSAFPAPDQELAALLRPRQLAADHAGPLGQADGELLGGQGAVVVPAGAGAARLVEVQRGLVPGGLADPDGGHGQD